MIKKISTLMLLFALLSCKEIEKTSTMSKENNEKETTKSSEKEPKVTGIGGIFFFSDNPDKTKDWYSENLGLEVNQWGSSFESRNANRPEEINYLQWSPFMPKLIFAHTVSFKPAPMKG